MAKAGIDKKFTSHSTRAAAVSAASRAKVPIQEILGAAGWSSCRVFAKYYNKKIEGPARFAGGVLTTQ
jgi:hypothetical protein